VEFQASQMAREAARALIVASGLRGLSRYVDSYTIALKAIGLFKELVEALREALGSDPARLGEALVAVADELASGAPTASPVFTAAAGLQVLYDELIEGEVDPSLVWLAMEKYAEVAEAYLERVPARVEESCRKAFESRVKVALVGGGRLVHACLRGLPRHSTVVVLEGFPERDGLRLYKSLLEERRDLRLSVLPDAFYWQAVRDTDEVLVYLDGVGRDGVALARAGSRPLAAIGKMAEKRVLGVTFTLAIEQVRMLRGVPRPGKKVTIPEVGESYTSPIYDFLDLQRHVDEVVTERGRLPSQPHALANATITFVMEVVGEAFKRALAEAGVGLE